MLTFKRTLVLKMKAQKVQVSPQPILRYTSSEDHRDPIVYVCIFYEAWDDILSLSESVGESAMDSATGFAGAITIFSLYWPFIFKLRQFGKGIVHAQENFNYCTKKPKKNYGKISLCTGMYDLF